MEPYPIVYKTAETVDECEQSYRLLHDIYVENGYMELHPSGMRFSIYNTLPEVRTFVATMDERVISCLTFIPDSPLGLPMDHAYNQELNILRLYGHRIAEISGFVTAREHVYQGSAIFVNFIKMLYLQVLVNDIDDICIVVHPRHRMFYEKILSFQVLGGLKEYGPVNNAPAYALRLETSMLIKHVQAKINYIHRSLSKRESSLTSSRYE